MSETAEQHFPFLQLELPGETGLDVGRYLIRPAPEAEPEAVLVVTTIGAPPKRTRFFTRKPRPTDAGEDVPEALTATRLSAVQSRRPMSATEAAEWLAGLKGNTEGLSSFIDEGVTMLNRAIHAQRAASMDPYLQEVTPQKASAVRVGFGSGLQVADGTWTQALRVPSEIGGRRSGWADSLRPQERVASVLGAKDQVSPFETLLLRARLDLDQSRPREAAMQLRAGVEALLSDVPEGVSGDELRDLEALDELRDEIAAAADEAAAGSLSDISSVAIVDGLKLSERVLRRRRILGTR